MAELLMECEEEELEPWQQRIKEVEDDDDDDDDEPIFVREICASKTTNTSSTPGTGAGVQHGSPRIENGAPARGTFQSSSNHCKTPSTSSPALLPATPVYQPINRTAASSAIVQPLPRPMGSPEPLTRPVTGCIPTHQPPRSSPAIQQPACRPVTIPSNSQPVCRNITFPTMTQPALRPVATITAQPVILNQGYIVNSNQVSSNNSQNVMFALRQSTPLTPYQSAQSISTGTATPLVRPLQPLTQIRPAATPARAASTVLHRPTNQGPPVTQNNISLVPAHQQPLVLNSQKTQNPTTQCTAGIGRNESALLEKRPAAPDLHNISPKKPKNNENGAENRSTTALSPAKPNPTTPSQNLPLKGSSPATTQVKNGAPFPRACPKCNIHFNLMEPMKRHMKYCCPNKMHDFFLGVIHTETPSSQGTGAPSSQVTGEEVEKGKLIMLVSDFYYGKHEGDMQLVQQEKKTHTTFRCFSCQKVLKNNVRFMNHMKHHLELEKQSTESWENHTTCHHCYRQFPTPFQLQCHIESSHTLYESTTICKICELSFESEQILLQHMKDNHKPGEMPYVCQICSYRSSTFVEVDNHFRNSHENTKCLLCPFCLKVIKAGTTYMQHYMKHQKKGVYRCGKCRLQFLTCKEKMDHKMQHHRTFRKPRQLEGLPPGTKVTIRASVGSITNTVPTPTSSVCTSPTSTALPVSSKVKSATTKTNPIPAAKTNTHPKPKPPPAKKKPPATRTPKRIKIVNTALRNLRASSGFYKCIECQLEVKDFESHFHTYVHCSKCKFSTNCNKAYTNHMVSFHGRNSSKRSWASKKAAKDKRRITLVCLNCDFLTDVSGLDEMAKHLSENHTHSCQVILETVSIFTSTLEGDMSKSRLQSAAGLRANNRKKNQYVAGLTIKSIEEKHLSVTVKKESNTSGGNKAMQDATNVLLCKSNITSLESEKDYDKQILDSCPTKQNVEKPKLLDTDNKDGCGTVQEHISGAQDGPQSAKSSAEEAFNAIAEYGKVSLQTVSAKMGDHKDLDLTDQEGLSFEQFLRRRDELESLSSDLSEQSSVHLEPLTPSEVLEHEACEILQKGGVAANPNKGPNGEQAEDIKENIMDASAVVNTEAVVEES